MFRIKVDAAGTQPSGKVVIKVAGKTITKKLKQGRATVRVAMTKLGKNKVVVKYSGDDSVAAKKKVVRVTVTR